MRANKTLRLTMTLVLPLLLLAAATGPAFSSAETAAPERVIVERSGAGAAQLAAKHGLSVAADYQALGLAVLEGPQAVAKLQRASGPSFAEADGIVRVADATWDSAAWDSAAWDSAAWDSAAWDSAAWDSAAWDSAAWDSAAWDSVATGGPVPPWGLHAIRAPEAWAHGVVLHNRLVCIVDSGIDADHPALSGNLWRDSAGRAGINLVAPGEAPTDEHGHGTHLAGIVAARPHPGLGVAGVAAPLVASAKAMGADGTGRTTDVLAGVAWCLSIGADILLLALTEDAPTKAFTRAVQAAASRDVIVVASAGNAGPCNDCVSSPASIPGVVAVGAFDVDGSTATFSASGPQVALLAPGVKIASTFPGGLARASSGTSQAAAFAAGSIAFLWAHDPEAPSARIVAQLASAAAPHEQGGRLDLAAAVASGAS